MATARPPGGGQEIPRATIGFDYSQLRNAPNVARQAGQATARELSQAFRAMQAEQRVALTQAQTTLAAVRAQQIQITATTRAESSIRMSAARAEAQARQQAARVAANTAIEEQRRITAQTRSELRIREAEQRAALRAPQGGFVRGLAGAALGALGGPIGAIAGAAAGGAGAAAAGLALAEGARLATEASKLATAYDRQRVAAVNLSGSQAKLNELLRAYEQVTGGAVNRATALNDTTRLMAIGFADTTQELEQFVRAARGISVATGQQQDYVISQLQLAIANQSTLRLDQLGLGVTEVKQRIDELKAANRGLTDEMAYQQAVLGMAEEKFGALVDSIEAQATGLERTTRAWHDLRLETGQITQGPLDFFGRGLALFIEMQTARLREWTRELDVYIRLLRQMGMAGSWLTSGEQRWVNDAGARTAARRSAAGTSLERRGALATPAFSAEQTAVMVDRYNALNQVTREEGRNILDTTRQFERQRAETISNYQKQVAREAEDFARQRANQERRLQMQILDVHQDSARQRVRWETDTARTIDGARAERDERLAEARANSVERIADIEEKFNREREKRQRSHAESLRDAAANLDAVQVRELQRQQREENEEAERARDEAIADERESLQERIDEANKAFAKQEADQRAALQRRITLQAEDDRLRIEEMKAAFEEQKAQEDIERGIRLERQAADHQAQLGEMAIQHGERIQQIKDHAQEERDQINEEHQARLKEVGIQTDAWIREQELLVNAAIASHKRFWEELTRPQLGPNGQPVQWPSLSNPFVNVPPVPSVRGSTVNSSTRQVTIHPGAVQIFPPVGMNEQAVGDLVLQKMAEFLERYNN